MSILRVIINRIAVTLSLLLCVVATGGCQQKKAGASHDGSARADSVNVKLFEHLEHYWDGYDPGRLDADSVEQRLVDYLFLTINAPSPEMRRDCWQTIARIFPDSQPNRTVADYLGQPDSPLYAPYMLEEYLVALTEMFPPETPERLRVDYLLDGIRKNKPGTKIADLRLFLSDGTLTTLRNLIADSGGNAAPKRQRRNESRGAGDRESNVDGDILILFYDPECEECSALISELAASGDPRPIIAISVTSELKDLPANWVSAKAADPDQLDTNFYLPSLPRLYRVHPDATIL